MKYILVKISLMILIVLITLVFLVVTKESLGIDIGSVDLIGALIYAISLVVFSHAYIGLVGKVTSLREPISSKDLHNELEKIRAI